MATTAKELYSKITRRKYFLLITLAVATVLLLLTDICVGSSWKSIDEVLSAIFMPGSVDRGTRVIVWEFRIVFALMAVLVGAALGIAGAQMQTILDNPLASPYTLGISAGAGFGAALAMISGVAVLPVGKEYTVAANAFLFAMGTCVLIYFVARQRKLTKESMVLAGIAVLFFFTSALAVLQYYASDEELRGVIFWLFGDITRATWPKVGIVAAVLFVVIPLLAKDAWKLTSLRLGDEKAKSLGIDVERLRLKVFLLVSLLTGAAVCFVGIIGFIGLVGPHIARMLVGEDQRFFLPTAALSGALVLCAADIVSKLIDPNSIFPVGIVTAAIGLPIFFALILGRKRAYW